ncbi:hypothetical protein AJ79_08324 [Helicocarpus griseus UAMH5409]|uniref:Uncharacterized protein n=1 Tax=Helicocarpus griseus UAMH5409 TaxID=1447875 RepID=A0A2B7WTX7_9EURO|nr:hypothetical protein AJ79_08324 [Helicocarpus griseus UAMH5409]
MAGFSFCGRTIFSTAMDKARPTSQLQAFKLLLLKTSEFSSDKIRAIVMSSGLQSGNSAMDTGFRARAALLYLSLEALCRAQGGQNQDNIGFASQK